MAGCCTNKKLDIKIKKLNPLAIIPQYQTKGAAAVDLHSVEDMIVPSNEWRLIKTGLAFELPEGFEGQIRPRSGLALKFGISIVNSPGTLDSDYRGELGVILYNSDTEPFLVHQGDRIAQMVIAPVIQCNFTEVNEFETITDRNSAGFGTTGIK